MEERAGHNRQRFRTIITITVTALSLAASLPAEAASRRGPFAFHYGPVLPSLTASYETMYERVARDTGSMLIPDLLDGIQRDPALKSDDIHPNGRGYQLMAERVAGPVKTLIRKADASR